MIVCSSSATCSSTCGKCVPSTRPLDESAVMPAGALVRFEGRKRAGQPLRESGHISRRDLLERSLCDIAGNDGRKAPVVWTAKRANPRDAQLVRVEPGGRLDRRAGGSGSRHAETIPPP
jgi:hypothetical protein